jgi:arginyl-tRNA synthetase
MELCALFHSYYNSFKIISSDIELTKSRLRLILLLKRVLGDIFNLLGIDALESM